MFVMLHCKYVLLVVTCDTSGNAKSHISKYKSNYLKFCLPPYFSWSLWSVTFDNSKEELMLKVDSQFEWRKKHYIHMTWYILEVLLKLWWVGEIDLRHDAGGSRIQNKILQVDYVIRWVFFLFVTVSGGGISSYAGQHGAAGKSLEACLDQAVSDIPKERHHVTPVYLGATAGMRLLQWVSVCLSVCVTRLLLSVCVLFSVDFALLSTSLHLYGIINHFTTIYIL